MQRSKTKKQKKTEYVLGTFFQAAGPVQSGQAEEFFFRQVYNFTFGATYLYGRERVLVHITATYGGTYIYFDSSMLRHAVESMLPILRRYAKKDRRNSWVISENTRPGANVSSFLMIENVMFPGTERNCFANLFEVNPCKIKESTKIGRIVILAEETFFCQRLIFKTGTNKYVAYT